MEDGELSPVMLALGRAVWAAQFFEMMLGSTLIALTIAKGDRSKIPDQAVARKWLDQLERSTLGKVRKQIEDLDLLPECITSAIVERNARRNEVVHHFMGLWTDRLSSEKGRQEAIDYLEESAEGFLKTAQRLQAGLERMRELGLTEWLDPA